MEISGAEGGGGGGSEKALGGAEEVTAGASIDESGCSADNIGNGPAVDGGAPSRCSGSPACTPGSGKLAVLRRPMLPSLDGGVIEFGSIDGHGVSMSCSFRSTRSRSDSVSFRSCTSVVAEGGLEGGVGAELLRTNGGVGEGGRGWAADGVAGEGMGNTGTTGTFDCRMGEGSVGSSDSLRL